MLIGSTRKTLFFLAYAVCYPIATSSAKVQVQESLAIRCDSESFISVSARTRDRETFPSVELSLSDPKHRTQGNRVRGVEIPNSRYGQIVQVPNLPQHSKVLAIEVCDAQQGIYEVSVQEHGREPFVLDVTAWNDTRDTDSLILHHIAKEGRSRQYDFVFKVEEKRVVVRWLDKGGHEQMKIENAEW